MAITARALTSRAGARWIDRPVVDIAVAWCWVPLVVLQHWFEKSAPDRAATLLGLAFFISFMHQPLTLGLVYGDRVVLASRPRMYRWTPLVAVVAIVIGLQVSLTLVALIAGVWNAEHTLMQRYGLTRIYGRKAGDAQGRVEKAMYMTWLGVAMLFVAADSRVTGYVELVHLGTTNREGVRILQSLHTPARILLVPAVAAALYLAWRWWQGERALGAAANPAKWQYVAATGALIVAIIVDPLAGFTAYVATHAIEYFVTVNRSLTHRDRDESAIALATSTTARRWSVLIAYSALVAGFSLMCFRYNWYGLYRMALLTLGALHIFYDGFIWKLRRPRVAASLGIATHATPPVSPAPPL